MCWGGSDALIVPFARAMKRLLQYSTNLSRRIIVRRCVDRLIACFGMDEPNVRHHVKVHIFGCGVGEGEGRAHN